MKLHSLLLVKVGARERKHSDSFLQPFSRAYCLYTAIRVNEHGIVRIDWKIALEQILKTSVIDDCLDRIQDCKQFVTEYLAWSDPRPGDRAPCRCIGSVIQEGLLSHDDQSGPAQRKIQVKRKGPSRFLSMAFDFMPATTYSPTHFRVQYNRPCGA
jgi:hypothetical protein